MATIIVFHKPANYKEPKITLYGEKHRAKVLVIDQIKNPIRIWYA